MGLFGFGKKKEEQAPACACQCGCAAAGAESAAVKEPAANGARSVKVLGTGCASCHALLEHTKEAVAALGLDVEVEYVTDMAQIAGYGVMQMPALVVGGKVASVGKVLKTAEVEAILKKVNA